MPPLNTANLEFSVTPSTSHSLSLSLSFSLSLSLSLSLSPSLSYTHTHAHVPPLALSHPIFPSISSFPVCREAAKECRRKKKEYVRCLENRVAVLEAQNTKLMEELKTLKDMYCNKVDETGPQGAHPSMPPNAVPDGVSVTVQPVPPGMSVQMLNAMQQQQPPMQQ